MKLDAYFSAIALTLPLAGPAVADMTAGEQTQTLTAFNAERAITPVVSPLAWSPDLASYAQVWAQYLADNNAFMHRDDPNSPATYNTPNNPIYPGRTLGENLYEATGGGALGPAAVADWLSEKQYYNYTADDGNGSGGLAPGCTAPMGSACGHYTQAVWSATTLVGCGEAIGTSGWTIVVCNFYVAGNLTGSKPY